jgi:hypothetical protein
MIAGALKSDSPVVGIQTGAYATPEFSDLKGQWTIIDVVDAHLVISCCIQKLCALDSPLVGIETGAYVIPESFDLKGRWTMFIDAAMMHT